MTINTHSSPFEPLWTCRICKSEALFASTHHHCPNCAHERDEERIVFPDWDDLVARSEHRFSGDDWECCGEGWSQHARYCGCCGLQRPEQAIDAPASRFAVPTAAERDEQPVRLDLNTDDINVDLFDEMFAPMETVSFVLPDPDRYYPARTA